MRTKVKVVVILIIVSAFYIQCIRWERFKQEYHLTTVYQLDYFLYERAKNGRWPTSLDGFPRSIADQGLYKGGRKKAVEVHRISKPHLEVDYAHPDIFVAHITYRWWFGNRHSLLILSPEEKKRNRRQKRITEVWVIPPIGG